MKTRLLGGVSLLTLTLTLLWLVPFIVGTASTGPVETFEQALANAAKLDTLFYVTYLNATLLTLAATALYAGLYRYCKPLSSDWAALGVIFVPVYCAFNLVAYLSQITVVPVLVALQHSPEHQAAADVVLRLLIQQWPGSAVGVFNNLAYALLGIPSMIFGVLLLKGSVALRLAGILLALNGVACNVGIIGIVIGNSLLGIGSAVGGVLFTLALFPLTWALLHSEGSMQSQVRPATA